MSIACNCVAQADSLKASKNKFYIGLDYGYPVYNRMNVSYYKDDLNRYWLQSKSGGFYNINMAFGHKHMRYSIGVSDLKSEFRGRDFTVMFSGYKYYMYQNVKYDLVSVNLGIGYNIDLSQRQKLNVNLVLGIPAQYDFKMYNYYSEVLQPSDTSKFLPSKNCSVTGENFGRFPRFTLNFSYEYYILKQVALNANINFLYAYSYGGNIPIKEADGGVVDNSNRYCFLAYDIHRQAAIIVSAGLKFRFP
jgi:hypothetical protein